MSSCEINDKSIANDFTLNVAAELNQVPPEAPEELHHEIRLNNPLECAIDPMLLELLKVVLDSSP